MNVYWLCSCGNANKFETKELLVFTSEQKEKFIGSDNCIKCNKPHEFNLELKITDQK